MDELTNKQLRLIAGRLRDYAQFLADFATIDQSPEPDELEWDFPIFTTAQEIKVHLEVIVDAITEPEEE